MHTNRERYRFFVGMVLGALGTSILLPQPATAQGSKDKQTLVKVNLVRGFVTLYVNDQKLGTYGKNSIVGGPSPSSIMDKDVTSLVHPGKNTLRAEWSGAKAPMGTVSLSYAQNKSQFRRLADLDFGVMSKATDKKTVVFTLPQGDGSIGQTPTAAKKPLPGSRSHQTLLTANIVKGNATVFVNGKKVGSYSNGLVPLDISNYVKGGQNTLRLSWGGGITPAGSIEVSYAAQPSQFRKVAARDLNVFSAKKGDTTLNFELPQEAGK